MSDTFRIKPTWIQNAGLAPVRLPEPPLVQRTRGGQRTDLDSRWESAHAPAAFDALARAGVNLVYICYYSGFGIESERLPLERGKEAVLRAHERGLKAALRIQLGSFVPETMLIEEPESGNWLQVNSDGKAIPAAEPFRSRACFNSESYQRYMERVCAMAVETGADLIDFDDVRYNAEPDTCHCPVCVAAFREMLRNQYGIQDDRTRQAGRERFGHNTFTHIRPPRPGRRAALDAPLEQEWMRFKVRSVTHCVARLARMINKRSSECAVGAALEGMLHSSTEAEAGIGLAELSPYVDVLRPSAPGASDVQARKSSCGETNFLARTAGALEMALVPDADAGALERSLAENLAFNASGLCSFDAEAVGLLDPEWETRAECDLELRAIRDGLHFYTQHRGTLFLGARTAGGIALLRDGLSLAYGGAGAQQFAQARQALSDAGIPFDVLLPAQIGKAEGVKCVILPGSECLSDDAAKALDSFVLAGGGLVATDGAGRRDIWRRLRPEAVLSSLLGPEYPRALRREAGIGRVAYVPHVLDVDAFVDAVRFALGAEPPWRVEADSGTPSSRAVRTPSGGMALHVVHAGEDALRGLRCSVACERAPVSITPLAPGRSFESVPFSHDGSRISFVFDDVARYVCFKLDF